MANKQAPDRTIRISDRVYRTIQELKGEGTIQAVVEEAIEDLRRKRFFEELNAGFAALRAHPVAWAEELEERALWDNTLMDGLEEYDDAR